MGIFNFGSFKPNTYSNIKILNELEINGEKVEDDEDDAEDYTGDHTDNPDTQTDSDGTGSDQEPEDYTDGLDDSGDSDGGDDTGTEDVGDGTGTDDSVGDGTDSGGDDEPEDYTSMDDGSGDGTEDTGTDDGTESGDDEAEDYTAMSDGEGEDGSDGTEGNTDDGEGTEDSEESDGEEGTDNELKKIESELFSNLTPEQVAIKNYELKQNYINLYKTIISTITKMNDVGKTESNIELIKFISNKLIELKDMVDFNITKVYKTRTYIENNIIYQQCLSTMNALCDMINLIPNNDIEENIEDKKDIEDSTVKAAENNDKSQYSDTSSLGETEA